MLDTRGRPSDSVIDQNKEVEGKPDERMTVENQELESEPRSQLFESDASSGKTLNYGRDSL